MLLPDPFLHSLIIHTCNDPLLCSCTAIPLSDTVKYLGILLDSKLSWKNHIFHLKKKLRKYVYLFKELSHLLDRKCVLQAYFSLCQSILLYGNLGWGGTHKTTLQGLMTTQKLILKIILNKPRRYPSSELFSEAGVLDARQLYVKSVLVHFKQHPEQAHLRTHDHNTRARSLCLPPRMNKRFGQRHYVFLGSKFNNALPLEIKIINSISKFKKSVHGWLRGLGNEGTEHLFEIIV